MIRNNPSAPGGRTAAVTPCESIEAFDSLPRAVRRRLRDTVVNWEAVRPALKLRNGEITEAALLRRIDEFEQDELKRWANHYSARYGVEYPHVAAGATIQKSGRAP